MKSTNPFIQLCSGLLVTLLLIGCDSDSTAKANGDALSTSVNTPASQASMEPDDDLTSTASIDKNTLKQAYFGDLHIHSSWSLDAFAFGVRVGPEEAYQFARGGEIEHIAGEPIKLQGEPLDFMALTEHANYMGIANSAMDPQSAISKIPLIADLMSSDTAVKSKAMGSLFKRIGRDIFVPELNTDTVIESAWAQLVALANQHNEPGTFTAFVGYEYTSMPEGQNLHRNVIFRGSDVPARPFSTFSSPNPEDLWLWMDKARQQGSDVMAIPHNANGSNGLMYQTTNQAGEAIDAEYAALRMRNEPVSEVIQVKGQSEAHPALSSNDEWAQFAMLENILGRPDIIGKAKGSYARQALKDGLEMEVDRAVNPYRFGMIGSSDGHNAASAVEESNYFGKIGVSDGSREVRLFGGKKPEGFDFADGPRSSPFSAAGLAGIWAEANTREALFDALRAREVFATSGPRIRIRMFAGWDFKQTDLDQGIASNGYARGVPMGGELTQAQATDAEEQLSFMLQAIQDPLAAPLERLQIIKSWVDNGTAYEKVYDIACAKGIQPDPKTHRCALEVTPPVLENCSFDATQGKPTLSSVWQDPEFDNTQNAFYYARVLQIPTCRWSTYDAHRLNVDLPKDQPAWLQERAVTSPIWYSPST